MFSIHNKTLNLKRTLYNYIGFFFTFILMKSEHQCWNFVMSSFARIYGVDKIRSEEKFHAFALEWCDEHNYKCDIHLDDLRKVDMYFKEEYENWEY